MNVTVDNGWGLHRFINRLRAGFRASVRQYQQDKVFFDKLSITFTQLLQDAMTWMLGGLLTMVIRLFWALIEALRETFYVMMSMLYLYEWAQKLWYSTAVTATIRTMLSEQVQLKIIKALELGALKDKGWDVAPSSVASAARIYNYQETAKGIVSDEQRARYMRHATYLERVEQILEDARAHQGEDERLDKSIPKLEKAVRMLRENQTELGFGAYNRESWMAARKESARLAWGRKGAKRGGIRGRLTHVWWKGVDRNSANCIYAARQAKSITEKNLSNITALGVDLARGNLVSIADIVVGYVLTRMMKDAKDGKPVYQKVRFTERERGASAIELNSVASDPKPHGQPAGERRKYGYVGKGAERHWAQLPGVEDLDSGVAGAPNQVSRPILEVATQILNNQPGMAAFT